MNGHDLIGAALNGSRYALALVHAYFDESIAHKGRRTVCVAGYLIKDSQTKGLNRQWRRALKKYQLPYFRMSACAHGNEPFDHLSIKQRIAVEKRMIKNIKRRTVIGLAVTVDVDDLDAVRLEHPYLGSPYTFCLHWIIGGVAQWIDDANYKGRIAYHFEAGHQSQPEANRIMDQVFRIPEIKEQARYAQHSFVNKVAAPAVQAADILAWQWYTDVRHQHEYRPRRKDLKSLLEHPHDSFHVNRNVIQHLSERLGSIKDPTEFLMRFHLGDAEFRRIVASEGQSS